MEAFPWRTLRAFGAALIACAALMPHASAFPEPADMLEANIGHSGPIEELLEDILNQEVVCVKLEPNDEFSPTPYRPVVTFGQKCNNT